MMGHVVAKRDAEGHTGRIVISRPEKRNAWTAAMVRAVRDHVVDFSCDDAIKVVIFSAEGDDFSTGLDPDEVESILREAPGGESKKFPSQRARLHAYDSLWWGLDGLYTRVLQCPKITLLECRGACLEIGLYLSLCCDLVVASEDTHFGNPRWQHIGVDGDVSMLALRVGWKRAKELLVLGQTWSAREAAGYDLVDVVAPHDALGDAVEGLAARCSQIMRDGIAAEKHVVLASLAKLQVGTGFAAATAVGAWATNVKFRPAEFNFLRERRNAGTDAAVQAARKHFGR